MMPSLRLGILAVIIDYENSEFGLNFFSVNLGGKVEYYSPFFQFIVNNDQIPKVISLET